MNYNRKIKKTTPVVMSIAGSDSGSGAGIQADIKTFYSLNVFGTTVITAITAQNPEIISKISPVEPDVVKKQISTVFESYNVSHIKIGMVYSDKIALAIASELKKHKYQTLLIDPILRSTSGTQLTNKKFIHTCIKYLFPMATYITPNIPEAEAILNNRILSLNDCIEASKQISKMFNCSCILKGGHFDSHKLTDTMFYKNKIYKASSDRISVQESHGTGCIYSSAFISYLAKGFSPPTAFRKAGIFVKNRLKKPILTSNNHTPLI